MRRKNWKKTKGRRKNNNFIFYHIFLPTTKVEVLVKRKGERTKQFLVEQKMLQKNGKKSSLSLCRMLVIRVVVGGTHPSSQKSNHYINSKTKARRDEMKKSTPRKTR